VRWDNADAAFERMEKKFDKTDAKIDRLLERAP